EPARRSPGSAATLRPSHGNLSSAWPGSRAAGSRSWPADPRESSLENSEPADPMSDIVDRVREITRANERLFARLIEGERRFRGLAKAVWKVQEDEGRRLARELHDARGQTLTSLTLQLERLREKLDGAVPPELAARVDDSV